MATDTKASTAKYKVVGTRPIRHDGVDKVTGKALYGADTQLPGMLYGKVLRSPHAHARIKSIDTSKAEAHPEIKAVATAMDLPTAEPTAMRAVIGVVPNENILARGKALYKGHAVAAVAATSAHVAEEALSLIEVEYEVLPSVTDVEEAMKPDAPILHEHWTSEDGGSKPTNIASYQQFKLGDVEKGFEQADLVVEREFRTKTVHQGYIEPQNGTAWWTPDGRVTVWCSSQGHFGIRDNTARILGLPASKVKVVPMEIGGGFGGKLPAYLEPVAAVLSRKSGSPVKMTMTRTEVMEATGPTSGAHVKVKMGVTNKGQITAAHGYLAFEAGAFPGSPVGGATGCMFSPYNIENVVVDAYDVADNKPKTTAYRAPGAPIGALAVETIVDEICETLGMDSMDFRILNGAKEGTRRANGVVNGPIGMLETAEAVKTHPHYSAPLAHVDGKHRGRGVAMGFWMNGSGPSSVVASVVPDGTVSLVEGSVDIGGFPTGGGPAARRGAGNPCRRRQATGGRYRFDRLDVQYGRERCGIQDRLGRPRGSSGCEAAAHRARLTALGDIRRSGRVR